MQAEIFTLCDAASISHGKISLLGTFDVLNFSKFPREYGPFAIVARVRFDADEGNEHRMEVRWFDADGEEVDALDPIEIRLDHSARHEIGQGFWCIQHKWFPEPGEYLLRLIVDDTHLAHTPLMVRLRGRV